MENKFTYSISLPEKAAKEIDESYLWYEMHQKGIGDRFLEEILQRLQLIESNPELFPIKHSNYRESNLNTFPVVIIYRINKKKKSISIVSVFHTSRSTRNKYQ